MVNNSEISVRGVNSFIHKAYRNAYWDDKGKLNGIYTKELPKDIHFLNEVFLGNIELEGDVDLGNYGGIPLRPSQELDCENNHVFRKDERQDLTRICVRNVDENVTKAFKHLIIDKYGRLYGNMGHVLSMAMELKLKMRKGVLKVAKKCRTYAEHVLGDHIVSPLHEAILEMTREVQKVRKENQSLKEMFQKLMGMIPGRNKTRKRSKPNNKLSKAIIVLNELKKCNESSFAGSDYKEALGKCFGQADKRTVNSDLQALKNANLIFECRKAGLFGKIQYCFRENELYAVYNSPAAMGHVIEEIKMGFQGREQVTRNEVLGFIEHVSGLWDVKSLEARLNTLILGGYLTSFGSSGKIFDVHLD